MIRSTVSRLTRTFMVLAILSLPICALTRVAYAGPGDASEDASVQADAPDAEPFDADASPDASEGSGPSCEYCIACDCGPLFPAEPLTEPIASGCKCDVGQHRDSSLLAPLVASTSLLVAAFARRRRGIPTRSWY